MTPSEFRTIRSALGLTQKALAVRLGYNSYITVLEIEKGRVGISKALERLMTAYSEGYVPHDSTEGGSAPHSTS
jgi:transcriptional regulator with XRE-family HTH domain